MGAELFLLASQKISIQEGHFLAKPLICFSGLAAGLERSCGKANILGMALSRKSRQIAAYFTFEWLLITSLKCLLVLQKQTKTVPVNYSVNV